MKKKFFTLTTIILSTISLFSCHHNYADAEKKVNINRCETLDAPVKIDFYTNNTYSNKQFTDISKYEDMVVVLTRDDCTHCQSLRPLLRNYISSTHAIIYEVNINDYAKMFSADDSENYEKYKIKETTTQTPTMLFFKNGQVNHYDVPPNGNKDQADLNSFINSQVYLTNYYCLNTYNKVVEDNGNYYYKMDIDSTTNMLSQSVQYLSDKINFSSSLTVLYTWRRCGDCKSFKESALNDYFSKHEDKKIYYYEVDGFMQKKNSSDSNIKLTATNEWLKFNNDFSFKYFPTYNENINAYTSVVPTLVNYPSKENAVFLNHGGSKVNDDNTLSFEYAFYDEIKQLKTTEKVTITSTDGKEDIDTSKANYELNSTLYNKAVEIETSKVLEFLDKYN